MEVVENTLDVELDAFLDRPLFCFLATTDDGAPRVSPLWFLWEAGAVWMVADERKSYPGRVERHPEVALAVVDFDRAAGRVQHVGVRGRASVEPLDPARAERLLARYLGPDVEEWDGSRFPDPREWGAEMVLLRVEPGTVVARDQSYVPAPGVGDGRG
jgi:nitroimidazol reductase NimA-like FMN-containing flavoprotein (pyridoxamine 5'-phosphate oxidase superfamily)